MSWAHPLVLAGVIPVLYAVWRIVRTPDPAADGGLAQIARLWADRHGLGAPHHAAPRRVFRGCLLAGGVALALVALARPQWGTVTTPTVTVAREVMLAVDLSRSMLAEDVTPTRLARAKLLISALLDELRGERVGLVVFSGTAFVQSPLSADYEVLRDFVDALDPSYLPEGGTNYAAMLQAALQAFGPERSGDRYLVVLSDGEALDEHWQALIPALRTAGIRVIGLGIGTAGGALVPAADGGWIKDERGAAVLSRLEPRTLQALADATGGTYRDAAAWVDIADLVRATVAGGARGQHREERHLRLQDRYQWFLAPALLLILLSYWRELPLAPLARAHQTRGRRPHPASAPALAAVLMALVAWHPPRPAYAAAPAAPPPPGVASQRNALAATVAELSARPALAPRDYARLAGDTIAFASEPGATSDRNRAGVLDDALAAVARGEAADPRAADWPRLRRALEALKTANPTPPPSESARDQQQNQSGDTGDQHGDSARGAQHDARAGAAQGDRDGTGTAHASASEQNGHADDRNRDSASGEGATPSSPRSGSDTAARGADGGDGSEATAGGDAAPTDHDRTAPADHAAGSDDVPDQAERAAAPAARASRRHAGSDANRQPPAGSPPTVLDARGLDDDANAGAAAETTGDSPAPPPPSVRMVGGGRAGGAPSEADADALAQLKAGDAPAVLFDRMNRADGAAPPPPDGKDW
jgi:Ca-activated chloride channel family protein